MILPELGESVGPLQIGNFRTDMVDTVQQVGDIGSKVFFESISLNSHTASPIKTEVNHSVKLFTRTYPDLNYYNLQSLTGKFIDIRSLGGAIRGTFNTTKGLRLTTNNAPIMVSVNLDDVNIFSNTPPSITATTSNRQVCITL